MTSSPPFPMKSQEIFLGEYRAFRLLGEGGMGQVYLGRHLKTGQEVVIKVMHDHLAQVPAVRQSFQSELLVMMQFRHPYAVSLLNGSLDGPGRPCLVMEYIRGLDLEKHLEAQGRMTPERFGPLLGQLCQVLHAAHGSNILHRDLTLNNVMLVDADTDHESIKVMDFGLARLTSAFFIPLEKLKQGATTSVGGGTPDYIAPEQIRGEPVDQRADLYSVGVMLYKIFTGVLPFQEAEEVNDILGAHLHIRPPSFAQRGVTDIRPDVEMLVQQLLSKYPTERPANARDLAFKFQKAIGFDIVPPGIFDQPIPKLVNKPLRYRVENKIDQLEAWMPEAIAIVKLKGFAQDMGGEIVSSEPGRIRIQVIDPRRPAPPKGFLARLRAKPEPIRYIPFDLYMDQLNDGKRTFVEITMVHDPDPRLSQADRHFQDELFKRIARELRAYMISR